MTPEEIFAYTRVLRADAEKRRLPVMREKTAYALATIAKRLRAERMLEVGTCVGVSALTMLAATSGTLWTLEKDDSLAEEARENFARCGVSNRVKVLLGDCNETLRYLSGNVYDLVVLDGPKSTLDAQYELVLPTLRKGGVAFIDDMRYHGLLESEKNGHKQRTIVTAMRAFREKLGRDERVSVAIYEEEDGYAVLEKK